METSSKSTSNPASDDLSPQEELLVSGLDDWVYESWVLSCMRRAHPEKYDVLRPLCIGLIAEVIVQGFMVPGDVDEEGRHHPWQLTSGEAIERISREWVTDWSDELPDLGAIVWLANTPVGMRMAEKALARTQS